MGDIFETIWQLPTSHVTVSRRGADGAFINPEADILLEEVRANGGNCVNQDHAPNKLFQFVNETLFAEPTFATFIALLDNYTAVEGESEKLLTDPAHGAAVDAFVDAVLNTEPMQVAVEHIRQHLRAGITDAEIRDVVRRSWFEPYTNHYSGSDPFCVGFEHVFVGEDASSAQAANPCKDQVGGYHSWMKFYLDEKAGKTNYLGHDYESAVLDDGLADPHVATVIMSWRAESAIGGHGHTLLKKPGGFFVGTRPECEIALGTVALLAVLAGQYDNTPAGQTENHRRMKLGDSHFDLVLHPETIVPRQGGNPPQLGEHIRTMYPKYRGMMSQPTEPGGGTPTQPLNNGPIHITRALPNPVGTTDQGEWVEIKNVSAITYDLAEWRLTDDKQRAQPLAGLLAPGQTQRIAITRVNERAMMLSNKGGWILLFQANLRIAAVQYGRADEGRIFVFDEPEG